MGALLFLSLRADRYVMLETFDKDKEILMGTECIEYPLYEKRRCSAVCIRLVLPICNITNEIGQGRRSDSC